MTYLNTDLDLVSDEDLTALAAALESERVFSLHVTKDADGHWRASFETTDQHREPEANIDAFLDIVETLGQPHRQAWHRCLKREFNIGYQCDTGHLALNHSLSTELLHRVTCAGASLGLTLYPNDDAARRTYDAVGQSDADD